MNILELKNKLENGEITVVDLVKESLLKAKAHTKDGKNIFVSLPEGRALERAEKIDEMIKNGDSLGSLTGVPFVVKDNYLAFGESSTASSEMLEDFLAPVQATAVEKLEKAGAICIGKANLDAFAHGGSTENSAFGVTKNAVDDTKVAGGSSGGSAVSVALGIAPFALGTDTGGSIRQPASYNGVYGIKPTYGAVSRYGVVAMASSTDTLGVFANTAGDIQIVMDVMSGKDEKDPTSVDVDFLKKSQKQKLKVGVIKQSMTDDVQSDVKKCVEEYCEKIKNLGHKVEYVDMAQLQNALAVYYVVVSAEVSSNLARYDGVRYGLSLEKEVVSKKNSEVAKPASIEEVYKTSRNLGFMPENKRRILVGSYVLSSGYFDAYYQRAQKVRTLLINEYQKLFESYDVLVSPTAPTTAFEIGKNTQNPVQMYLADVMTVPVSLAGLPGLSVPAGKDSQGMPVGVQLVADLKNDALLLELAKNLEK